MPKWTFREQCVAAGILYKDLDSEGDSTTDDGGGKSMMLEDEAEEAEEDGRDVCAHVCSHNDRCEVCDDGHETNKRECFHAHGTWHGGMTPQMVSDVAGVPALAEAEARAVGSQLCGELPFEYHTIATAVRALRIGIVDPTAAMGFTAAQIILPDTASRLMGVLRRVCDTAPRTLRGPDGRPRGGRGVVEGVVRRGRVLRTGEARPAPEVRQSEGG